MIGYNRHMRQVATYWAPAGFGMDGSTAFAAPVPVLCRWEDKTDLVRDPMGNQVVSTAIAYTPEPLAVGGWFALGDHTAQPAPQRVERAHAVISTGSSPSLDQTYQLHKAWL